MSENDDSTPGPAPAANLPTTPAPAATAAADPAPGPPAAPPAGGRLGRLSPQAKIALGLGTAIALALLLWPRSRAERKFEDGYLIDESGATVALAGELAPATLVHFWATWCPPCRKELPGLLEFGRELNRTQGVELLAISVDQDWTAISAFFPGGIPPEVLKSRDRRVHTRYGVMTLPDTYLISPAGKLVLRFGSARDWTTAAAREAVTREAKTWR